MALADPSFSWQEALAAFSIIAMAAFLVTWVLTDLLRIPREPYIPMLLFVALALGIGYLAWSGTSAADLFSSGVGWGLATGLTAAAVALPLVRRLPAHPHATGTRLVGLMLWEGLVYGIAEAVLLSTLPVLALWQGCVELGWTDSGWAKIGSGVLAILGALIVILVITSATWSFEPRPDERGYSARWPSAVCRQSRSWGPAASSRPSWPTSSCMASC